MNTVELTKNIMVEKVTYKGSDYIDIRFYFNDKPTKKGIRFSMDTCQKLISILNNLLNNK